MDKFQNICIGYFKYKRKLSLSLVRTFSSNIASQKQCRNKLNLLFFGADSFSLQSLVSLDEARKLPSSNISKIDIVTSLKNYLNPVRKYAEKNDLLCIGWPIEDSVIEKFNYDLGIVVSFGHLIPEKIIKAFPLGMINVHASLLPKWRGASPIIYAILNEDTVTGVSVMKIHPKKFDVGEILAQKEVMVPPNVMMPDLHKTLADDGAKLLVECVENISQSLLNAKPQGDVKATYAPKIQDSMAAIDWQQMTARHIYNLYRALYTYKWLTTHWHKLRIKIRELDFPNDETTSRACSKGTQICNPGCVEYIKIEKCLKVHCIDGQFVVIKKLGVEGKRVMSAEDFNNGYLKKVNVSDRYFW